MTEPFVVEVWGKPAGVVLKDGNAFRFHAISPPFFVLDGAHFSTLGHARLAAARLEADRGRRAHLPRYGAAGRSLGKASQRANRLPL